jgi:hypothetical protein
VSALLLGLRGERCAHDLLQEAPAQNKGELRER